MNRVILTGNLTKDIELKVTQSGKKVCNFTIGNNDGDKTRFIDCQAWEKTAEIMDKFLSKGSKILVEGTLDIYEYESEKGKNRRYYVIANRVEFLNAKTEQTVDRDSIRVRPYKDPHYDHSVHFDEDDLPF